MALPVKTTADDVRTITSYLRNKAAGATVDEAKAAIGSGALDGRKLAAYEFWGIVSRDGDRIKLTPRGWELARQPENEATVFRAVLDSIVPYRSALEWMHYQGFDAVTTSDVGAQWHEHHSDAVGTDNENTLRENAMAFFRVAEAAGLGQVVQGGGRNRQPTRFKIDQEALKSYVEAGPSAPPLSEGGAADELLDAKPKGEEEEEPEQPETPPEPPAPAEKLRVFIAHGKNMAIVEQVETLLGFADIESEVAEEEETTAIPVPDKVFNAMRRCDAGIIVVSKENGDTTVNQNVLIEIGAAFVLYERRVILVWDRSIDVPSNLQGLYRCEFEGDELSWNAGTSLMGAIQQFKR
jgi:predicted nucleotide-binding protein